jgi:hypothetical protein
MLRKLLFFFLLLFPASVWALQITDLGGWSWHPKASGRALRQEAPHAEAGGNRVSCPVCWRRGVVVPLFLTLDLRIESNGEYKPGRAQQSNSMSGANASPTGQ